MALLVDALRESADQTAYYETPDGYQIIVEFITGQEVPSSEGNYIVAIQRGGKPVQDRFTTRDLQEAMDYLRSFTFGAFDPNAAVWRPAPTGIVHHSSLG